MFFKKDKSKYDWVLDYLSDDSNIKPNPYLWTRIKSLIASENIKPELSVFNIFQHLPRWIFSIGLMLSITLGTFIGHQLSAKVCEQTQLCPRGIQDSGRMNHDLMFEEIYEGLSEERF